MPVRRVVVVLNRRSGRGALSREALAEAFEAHGVSTRFIEPQDAAALQAAASGHGPDAPDVVVAAGGDGTVNAVANALAATGRPLGIVPAGTFNHIAALHGVPTDPADAVRAIAAGRTIGIGAGEIAGRLFLNNASFGLYTSIIDARERHERMFGRSRLVALLSALATVLRARRRMRVRIEHDGRHRMLRASLVFVGANPLQLDAIDPGVAERVREGALAVVVVRALDAGRVAGIAWKALTGAVIEAPEIDVEVVRSALLGLPGRHQRVVVDGERVAMAPPLLVRYRADALRLRVPAA